MNVPITIEVDNIPVTSITYSSEENEFVVNTERGAGWSKDLGEALKLAAKSHRFSVKKHG